MPSPVAIAGPTANNSSNSSNNLPPLGQSLNGTASHSVSSTASTTSPQTPFGQSSSAQPRTQPVSIVSSPPAVTSPGLNPLPRWTTSGLSTLGKSPPRAELTHIDQAASAPVPASDSTMLHDQLHASARDIHVVDPNNHHHHHDDDHHFEQHDSFEFGDFGDMKNKSWTSASASAAQKGRRAVSMSMASGQPLAGSLGSSPPAGLGPGSVMAMLTGFGSLRDDNVSPGAASATSAAGVFGTSLSSSLGSPTGFGGFGGGVNGSGNFNNGVLADKAAKAQGVMRRLSLSGGFQRAGVMSPPQGSGPLPPSPPTVAAPAPPMPPSSVPATASLPPPVDTHGSADDGAKAAARGFMNRGRRYSENGGKKRGVSPMGERILRDHGHF